MTMPMYVIHPKENQQLYMWLTQLLLYSPSLLPGRYADDQGRSACARLKVIDLRSISIYSESAVLLLCRHKGSSDVCICICTKESLHSTVVEVFLF